MGHTKGHTKRPPLRKNQSTEGCSKMHVSPRSFTVFILPSRSPSKSPCTSRHGGKANPRRRKSATRPIAAGGPVRRLIRMGWGTTRVALALALTTLGFDSPCEPDHGCAGLTGPLEGARLALNPQTQEPTEPVLASKCFPP